MSGVTTHSGCALDYPEDVALAYGTVRGHQLILADVRGDGAASRAVLDEIGDCAECFRNMVLFLTGVAGSISVALAENAGADRAAALRQWESGLAAARSGLP